MFNNEHFTAGHLIVLKNHSRAWGRSPLGPFSFVAVRNENERCENICEKRRKVNIIPPNSNLGAQSEFWGVLDPWFHIILRPPRYVDNVRKYMLTLLGCFRRATLCSCFVWGRRYAKICRISWF